MVDMLMLQGAVSGLKMAGDIAHGFLKLKSMSEVQGLTIELQSTILAAQTSALAAQSEQSSMIQRIGELEKEIARIEAWEEEKQRYQLVAAWPGCFLYALKESSKGTEPAHWICEHCYQNARKSILQNSQMRLGRIHHMIKCFHCQFEVERESPGPEYA